MVATWQGRPIDCAGADPALTDLRFYISDPQLADADGRYHDVRFATEFSWQNDAVAFIDLETGRESCADGTEQVFDRVIGVARARDYKGLRFTIGVPFRLNHVNPETAPPPLDEPSMQRRESSGFMFFRVGVGAQGDGFRIRGGSAGCEGAGGHITGCRFPNRIDVVLTDFVPGESVVEIDLAELAAGTDLEDGSASDCSSGPGETSCVAPFEALGIDFATGAPNGRQRVFSVR